MKIMSNTETVSIMQRVRHEFRSRHVQLLARNLGIPNVAVDAVFDSVSVATTFKDKLSAVGVIFCSFSEAVREHPELVRFAEQQARLGADGAELYTIGFSDDSVDSVRKFFAENGGDYRYVVMPMRF